MQGWGRAEASYYRRGYGMRVRARRNGRQRKWRVEKLLVVPPPQVAIPSCSYGREDDSGRAVPGKIEDPGQSGTATG